MNKLGILSGLLLIVTNQAFADAPDASGGPLAAANLEAAQGETLSKAVGHYARARSLLIEAVREFDRGARTARPDAIIDADEWRSSLVSRAEDLERILAPQPRVTKGGVKFEANTSLLNVTNK
jgi:hypothetical protein